MEQTSSSQAEWLAELDGQYRGSLLAFFRRRTGSASEAEDLVQEVLIRICAIPGLERETAGAYLFRVAANLLNDRARRAAVRANYADMLGEETRQRLDSFDPERLVFGRFAVGMVKEALDALPERTRTIFILYRLEGMARKEIAQNFGISVSAVEKHIANAMKSLLRLKETWQ